MPLTLKEIVWTNLDHAKDNGYFEMGEQFHNVGPDFVVDDMLMCCPDVEGHSYDRLLPLVTDWMKHNGLLRLGS